MFGGEVKEGRVEVWEAALFSKGIKGYLKMSGCWLRLNAAHQVEKVCSGCGTTGSPGRA